MLHVAVRVSLQAVKPSELDNHPHPPPYTTYSYAITIDITVGILTLLMAEKLELDDL